MLSRRERQRQDQEEVIGRVEEREERVEVGDEGENGCQERAEDGEALRGLRESWTLIGRKHKRKRLNQ